MSLMILLVEIAGNALNGNELTFKAWPFNVWH